MRGLGLRSGEDAEVCEIDAVPKIAARLGADRDRMRYIGDAARRTPEERFSWRASGALAPSALDQLVGRPQGS